MSEKNKENKYDNMTDDQIMEKLMNAGEVPMPEVTVRIKRLNIPVTLRGISDKKVITLQNKYTYTVRGKRGGNDTEETNWDNFAIGLIVACTVKPDFKSQELMNQYQASGPEEVMKRIFLPGELRQLADVVYDLCGYNDSVEEVKELKN